MYPQSNINRKNEQVRTRTEEHKISGIPSINSNMKSIIKRDTSSLKDLRKDLNKLLIHQLQKQVFNTSRSVRNKFQVPNTLTNTQTFMKQFLNSESISNKGHRGMVMGIHNTRTNIASINNFQRQPSETILGNSNSAQVPNRNKQSINVTMQNALIDRKSQQTSYISSPSQNYGQAAKSMNVDKEGKSPAKTTMTLYDNGLDPTSPAWTKSPTMQDYRTTLTRHYNVVHSTKSKKLPGPTLPTFTPTKMPTRHISNTYPTAAAATVLQRQRKDHFNVSTTKLSKSAFTQVPRIKTRHDSTIEHINALTTVSPVLFQRSTKTLQIQSINPEPTPVVYTYTHPVSTNITKAGAGSNHGKMISTPRTTTTKIPENSSKDRGPTINAVNETSGNTTINNSSKLHLSKLINLQGIHILFTNDKPNYTSISKNPTLHLTASVKTPAKDERKTSRQFDNTAHIRTSASDVHFSTSSKNKYVGTAMMKNGHLFLVIYPPDRIDRHSAVPVFEKSKNSEQSTKTNQLDSAPVTHDNITTKGNTYQINSIPSSSTSYSEGESSTFRQRSHLNSLLGTTIRNSIFSGLKPYPTGATNLAYQHGTATIKLQTSTGESLSKHHENYNTLETRTHTITTSKALQEDNGATGSVYDKHDGSSELANENARHKTKAHVLKPKVKGHTSVTKIGTAFHQEGHTLFENNMKNTGSHLRLQSDHPAHHRPKSNKIMPNVPAKATDPFQRIHGTHIGNHSRHVEAASTRSTTTEASGSAKRFGSPWKNVDLSAVLPSFSKIKSHNANESDDDSNPNLNVYSFVAKATDPFDRIQRILDKLQSSEHFSNQSKTLNDDTSFNFELTVHSNNIADTAANSDDENKSSSSKNDTADELLELLSSTIHKAAKAYDKDLHRDNILQKLSELANSESLNSTGSEKLMNKTTTDESKSQSVNDTFATNVITKHLSTGERLLMSVQQTASVSMETLNRSAPYQIDQTDTTHNVLPLLASSEINPTIAPDVIIHTRNGSAENIDQTNNTRKSHLKSKLPDLLENQNNHTSHRGPTFPPDIVQMIAKSNISETDRKTYIRNQLVHDIIKTKPTDPPTPKPKLMDFGHFQNHLGQHKEPVLQEFIETRQSFSGRKMASRENDLFLKRQSSRKEIHHEMPLSKALYLIKQQTNELRSQKAIEQFTKSNKNPPFNSEFNAMLILSIDDILSDQTNLHGALVVSFLSENAQGQSKT